AVGIDDHQPTASCPVPLTCDAVPVASRRRAELGQGEMCLLWGKASGDPCIQRDVVLHFYCAYQRNPSLPNYTNAMSFITDNLVCNSAQDHCRDEIDIRSW
ncbi:MAG: hypothetical protein HYV63_31045, partial [Candidatus Schekmanbacteria bacterium]|nr:hypothetical protein [Candidatus Schekmanbacteria bacterium]